MIFCPWVSDRWKLDNMMKEERGGRTSTTKTEMAAAVTQFSVLPFLPSLPVLPVLPPHNQFDMLHDRRGTW